ncbi:MAG: chemotaxis protein [Rhodospirillaceae bacterium]|nr:MAG: chemotaxis protein [Rhodospirillaceae bacterium]
MKNLKISIRAGLAVLLPILGLLFFSSSSILEKRHIANQMQRLQHIATLAPVISDLIHDLQKERGASSIFIGSKGKKFKAEMPAQYAMTDAKIVTLMAAFQNFDPEDFNPESMAAAKESAASAKKGEIVTEQTEDNEVDDPLIIRMHAAVDALNVIEKTRKKVAKRRLPVLRMAKYYTNTIVDLMAIVEEMTVMSSEAKVTVAIAAYTSFLQSKERSGIERDIGGAGFLKSSFKFFTHKKFVELIAQQEAFMGVFAVNATPAQMEFFKQTVSGKNIDEIKRMRIRAIASIQKEFDTKGVTTDHWYQQSTQKIEQLKVVENKISNDLTDLVAATHDTANAAFTTLLIITLVLLIITAIFVVYIVRGITVPVAAMTVTMLELAKGNLDLEIPGHGQKDEIGQMATAVEVFRDREREMQQMAKDRQVTRDKAEQEKRKMMLDMADDFENSVGGVVKGVSTAATEMHSSAQSLSTTAEETSRQSETVATASTNATNNVQTVAAAAEELSSSIQEISRQVSQSTLIAGTAVVEVESTNDKIQSLAEAANKIGEVVAMITDIADQTNLLALNATIEAARAGEAGKGFAVVASEVKNLANQTAKATEEISSQISNVQGATQDAVTAIGSIGNTISQINEISSSIAAAVEEQGAATQEIARNVEMAAGDTTEVSTNIAGVTQAADETGNSADQMLGASDELSQQAETLRTEVERFLNQIRKG